MMMIKMLNLLSRLNAFIMIAKAWDNVKEGTILGCFKEIGFDCNIDSEIIIQNDLNTILLFITWNDQIYDNINFNKYFEICNQISENWESEFLDNFVERSVSIHRK